jgi:hypothetical protein
MGPDPLELRPPYQVRFRTAAPAQRIISRSMARGQCRRFRLRTDIRASLSSALPWGVY